MMIPKWSFFWMRIQGSLFLKLERAFECPLTEEHKRVARTFEILRIEEMVKEPVQWTGRPVQEWIVLCRAFVAKAVLGLHTMRSLIDRLRADENLARMCGWKNASKVSHESTFSRLCPAGWSVST
ncbi:transposase [Leptospirillum ferriphilum]|uniref:transposase n=1 Tax=Leptospirillum ferriphilum TaxID=178606 RepID=UPI0006B1D39C|nr:transposase [Leptospirillum ferriphilum]